MTGRGKIWRQCDSQKIVQQVDHEINVVVFQQDPAQGFWKCVQDFWAALAVEGETYGEKIHFFSLNSEEMSEVGMYWYGFEDSGDDGFD